RQNASEDRFEVVTYNYRERNEVTDEYCFDCPRFQKRTDGTVLYCLLRGSQPTQCLCDWNDRKTGGRSNRTGYPAFSERFSGRRSADRSQNRLQRTGSSADVPRPDYCKTK